jgi:hypothetical protein
MLLNVFFGEQAQNRAREQSKDAERDGCSGCAGDASEIYVEFPDGVDLTPNSNLQDLSHLCL